MKFLTSGVAIALALGLLLPVSASGQGVSRVGGVYLFGANMPWLNWNSDFGGGPNGGGVSGNLPAVDAKLKSAHDAGMHMVRWWVFEGGSPQIQRNGAGAPTGLNSNVYTDLDAALGLAAKYDISFDLVLFGSTNDDGTTHQWWENSGERSALVGVLTPLFARYAANARVHTWEIVNEPEWQSRNSQTTVAGMLATGAALANAVHANSHALVTVGNAQMQDMATWVGQGLDYYSPHYYDNFGTGSNDPFVTSAGAASPDGKAVVIGEFPAGPSGLNPDAATRWRTLYADGYAGGWAWSLSPERTSDNLAIDLNAAAAFAVGKSDLGPVGAGAPPTATPVPPTATPTATRVPPTATPGSATSTPTPTSQLTWTTMASLSSSSVAPGGTMQVKDLVTASQNASGLVDVEIYDAHWTKVAQTFWDKQQFSAGLGRSFGLSWAVPAGTPAGSYTVMVGTFAPGWSREYTFNKSAATFTVR